MSKNEFWGQKFKNRSPDSESPLPRYHCVSFELKQTTLTFLAQICSKRKLGFEIHKTNVGIRINTLRYQVYQFSDKTENFEFLDPNLPKNGFWGRNFKNLSLDSESASLRCYVHQFSDKTDNFEFLGPNLPKNGFWGQNLKNLSLDSESVSLRYCVHQF